MPAFTEPVPFKAISMGWTTRRVLLLAMIFPLLVIIGVWPL